MHIEFAGIPGAGKTTHYRSLLAVAKRKGLGLQALDQAVYEAHRIGDDRSAIGRMVYRLPFRVGRHLVDLAPTQSNKKLVAAFRRFVLQHRELSSIISHAQCKHAARASDMGLLVFLWLFEFLAKYQLAAETTESALATLFDEGFLQRIVTLFAYDIGTTQTPIAELRQYTECMPKPRAVIMVNADPEICERRMAERGYPFRLQGRSREDRLQVLRRASECIELAIADLEEKSIQVIRIDNTNETAKDVMQGVVERLMSDLRL